MYEELSALLKLVDPAEGYVFLASTSGASSTVQPSETPFWGAYLPWSSRVSFGLAPPLLSSMV